MRAGHATPTLSYTLRTHVPLHGTHQSRLLFKCNSPRMELRFQFNTHRKSFSPQRQLPCFQELQLTSISVVGELEFVLTACVEFWKVSLEKENKPEVCLKTMHLHIKRCHFILYHSTYTNSAKYTHRVHTVHAYWNSQPK